MLNRDILGFRSTIKASGAFGDLKSGGFSLSISFDTNGFSQVTQEISDFLHKKADDINKATHDASQKLDNAKQTLKAHNSDLNNTQKKINNVNATIASLKRTHYPWYKAYKYTVLLANIATKEIEVGALSAYKLTVLGLIKTAQGILTLAEKSLKEAGKLTADTIKLIGDVTSIVGKSIDWLIRLDHIEAAMSMNCELLAYNFDIKYQLCGKSHEDKFNLSLDAKLADELLAHIKGGNNTLNDAILTLGSIYGDDEVGDVDVNLDDMHKFFTENSSCGERSAAILSSLHSDMTLVNDILSCDGDSINSAYYSQSISPADVNSLNQSFNSATLSYQSLSNFNGSITTDDYSVLNNAFDTLSGDVGNSTIQGLSTQQLERYENSHSAINDLADNMANLFMVNCGDDLDDNAILPDTYVDDLIARYKRIVDEPSDISDYMRMIFSQNLACALRDTQSKDYDSYANKALGYASTVWGENSDEYNIVKDNISK